MLGPGATPDHTGAAICSESKSTGSKLDFSRSSPGSKSTRVKSLPDHTGSFSDQSILSINTRCMMMFFKGRDTGSLPDQNLPSTGSVTDFYRIIPGSVTGSVTDFYRIIPGSYRINFLVIFVEFVF
jgi:hypothetical protein